MDKLLKKELKKILTGRVIVREDGVLTALSQRQRLVFHGASDGWASVQFNGISRRECWLRIANDSEVAFEMALCAVQNLGRLVELVQAPDTLACIRRYVLNKPVVIAVDYAGEGIVCVTAYTGKSLTAAISCRRGLKDFCHALPQGEFQPVEVPPKKTGEEKKKKETRRLRLKKRKGSAGEQSVPETNHPDRKG